MSWQSVQVPYWSTEAESTMGDPFRSNHAIERSVPVKKLTASDAPSAPATGNHARNVKSRSAFHVSAPSRSVAAPPEPRNKDDVSTCSSDASALWMVYRRRHSPFHTVVSDVFLPLKSSIRRCIGATRGAPVESRTWFFKRHEREWDIACVFQASLASWIRCSRHIRHIRNSVASSHS